ncbi:MAG: tyrosine-type recombinase/integrase [Limisphaerales bacterium]
MSKHDQEALPGPVVPESRSAAASPRPADKTSDEKSEGLGKTHVNHWRKRLYKNTFTRAGQRFEVKEWCVKIQHLGVRRTFSLGSVNKDIAAAKAKDIYLTVVSKGWAAANALYNPEMIAQKDDPSLADFLGEVEAKASLKPKTFRNYASCFRTIVAEIMKVGDDKAKYDYRSGGHETWLASLDAIRLSAITPDRVQAWKVGHIRAAGASPKAQASAKRTVNSYIRCSRSLFSPSILKFIRLRLPNPLPFDGVELEEAGSMRYKSTINPELLMVAAKKELRDTHPESYKAFLLGLLSGLRRSEIDLLEWSAIDWQNNRIWIGTTEHFDVKTEDSEDFVEVDAEVLEELRRFMKGGKSPFVLNSKLPPRVGLDRQYYRCDHVFDHLIGWLRGKGIKANKPIHELRKEFGSLVNQKFGIYAASRALRHSDITTSTRHYVATKQRVTVGLGHLLAQPTTPQAAADQPKEGAA